MGRVTGIGGVFQRGGEAASLRDWYAEHLGIDIADWGGKPFEWTPGGSTTWAIFDGDTGDRAGALRLGGRSRGHPV